MSKSDVRGEPKYTVEPSRDHTGCRSGRGSEVSLDDTLRSTSIVQMSSWAPAARTTASRLLSGENWTCQYEARSLSVPAGFPSRSSQVRTPGTPEDVSR